MACYRIDWNLLGVTIQTSPNTAMLCLHEGKGQLERWAIGGEQKS